MIEFSLIGFIVYTSIAIIFGFIVCAILAAGKQADQIDAQIYENGIFDRDEAIRSLKDIHAKQQIENESLRRTTHNQALKIGELLKVNSEMHDTINQIDDSKIIKIMRSN